MLDVRFVSSVAVSDEEALLGIMRLYAPLGFDADVTYSTGRFYRGSVPQPLHKFDIAPQIEGVLAADCRRLPVPGNSWSAMVCDLPFIHAPGKKSIIGNRFKGFKSQAELRSVYQDAMFEFYRVLAPNGVVAWKCQDIVESGKQNWTHCWLWLWATEIGFYPLDQIVVIGGGRKIVGHNHKRQVHARRGHCVWWVFRKP